MTRTLPRIEHRYENHLVDSARWERYKPRAGDIVIATPYKSGTTWTQRICSLLIFNRVELDRPLGEISPWLDARFSAIDDVIERYEAQTHRRFIKTHSPLTSIPYFEEVTYLVCARDPRDVFVSIENHYANLDMPVFLKTIARHGGDTSAPPPTLPDDVNERFRLWLTRGTFEWESDGFPFWSIFSHTQSFWRFRQLPNIHFVHFADLSRDLDAEMRRIANILGIEVDETRWPELVGAATFEAMKRDHRSVGPNMSHAIWRDPKQFFRSGKTGQWRDLLSAESLALYETVKRQKLEPSLTDWIDNGASADAAGRAELPGSP